MQSLFVGVIMEIWKKSTIDENYEVSSLGRVRSVERVVEVTGHWGGKYRRRYGGKLLSPAVGRAGYQQIIGTKKKFYHVHRLVAKEFVPGFAENLVVNHKNGIRADNRPENLEWITHSENLRHGYRVLGSKPSALGVFGGRHPKSRSVVATCIETGERKYYECISDASREGFSGSSISGCARGRLKSHSGYYWDYVDASTQKAIYEDKA